MEKNNMLLYYSRKYSYLNFTIYATRIAIFGANVMAEEDQLRSYIKVVDECNEVSVLSLYCDSCPG
ncbi:hypothetical protein PR048_018194 [Dryococelus australis]|uniref:Uncharacterized protein n=1 Tax=Dryococelus australis TaxID=614101 RepID=A0ABQ9HCA0_9NEOP|nr:hypothetical protein PR048_018194 [Dryococelus australis]